MQVKKSVQLRKVFFEQLGSLLRPEGFVLNRGLERFILKSSDLELQFWTLTNARGRDVIEIELGLGIRHLKVESIYHHCSGVHAKWQSHSPTYSIDLWRFAAQESGIDANAPDESFVPRVDDAESAANAAAAVYKLFQIHAKTFFSRYRELQNLDVLFNSGVAADVFGLPTRNLCTGIIVAKLVGRTNFDQLITTYRIDMRNVGDSVSLAQFDCTVRALDVQMPTIVN